MKLSAFCAVLEETLPSTMDLVGVHLERNSAAIVLRVNNTGGTVTGEAKYESEADFPALIAAFGADLAQLSMRLSSTRGQA